jgi:hypothetical protein
LALTSSSTIVVAETLFEGIYLKSPELCQRAKSEGLPAVAETGELVLTEKGLKGLEYNCQFVRFDARTGAPGGVATALCEEPGFAQPELFSILPRGEGELEVVSLADSLRDPGENDTIYNLCPGLQMP